MTDQLSDVNQLPENLRDPLKVLDRGERMCAVMEEIQKDCGHIKVAGRFVDLQDKVTELEHKIETCGLQCSATMKSLMREAAPAANPFDKAVAVFAGKKGDGYLLKCWFETQEHLDAAFDLVDAANPVLQTQPPDSTSETTGEGPK